MGEREACRKGDEVNRDKENGNQTSRNFWYETEFFVKDAKVTALVYWLQLGKKRTTSPKEIGSSKCHPNDCFNEYIGKAIALGRALGLDVSEFEQAVQPDEVVVGMEVEVLDHESGRKSGKFRDVIAIEEGYPEFSNGMYASRYDITNDTNAQYEEAQVNESNKAF